MFFCYLGFVSGRQAGLALLCKLLALCCRQFSPKCPLVLNNKKRFPFVRERDGFLQCFDTLGPQHQYRGLSGSKFSFPVLLCYCAILSFCYDVLSFCFNILSFFYWGLMCSYVMLLCYCAILLFRYDVLSFYFNILSYCY